MVDQGKKEPVKIGRKIVDVAVVAKKKEAEIDNGQDNAVQSLSPDDSIAMFDLHPLARPEYLPQGGYKIRPSEHISKHAIYITISEYTFPDGSIRPFELFLGSKDESALVWVNLASRLLSAILRLPLKEFPWFALDEFIESSDPRGGYILPGGLNVKSVAHHVGVTIEKHCLRLGLTRDHGLSDDMKGVLLQKKRVAEGRGIVGSECSKCSQHAVVRLDGCDTCLECGNSKCS